jgi:hypothetical protein
MIDWGISSFNEFQKMKERMEQTWNDLFEKRPADREEVWQWVERLPKFEGPGRRVRKLDSFKTLK